MIAPGGRDIGIVEWFQVGEHERVEEVVGQLRAMGARRLRTGISWADWYTGEGEEWYGWLLPTLARHFEVLPCFLYTPPSIGVEPRVSAPPRRPREYADVLDLVLDRVGEHFEYVELWNEPNNLSEWDWTIDAGWSIFTEMITDAAHWARVRGKKTVLGGMSPIDPAWLTMMWDRGLVDRFDAVGIHAFPGTWEASWPGWDEAVARVRRVWENRDAAPELWVTEVGYSTWNHDEIGQARRFLDAMAADAERIYWYSAQDLDPVRPTVDGFHSDEREYHFGLRRGDGSPKLLARLLERGGLPQVRDVVERGSAAVHTRPGGYTLITGGSGFIGTNLAERVLEEGGDVRIFDNLSRPGVERNLRELQDSYDAVTIRVGDVRNPHLVREMVARADRIFHLAGQVAVTTSLRDPASDFDVNARGTLHLLEAIAARDDPPPLLFASTNKVYGGLDDLRLRLNGDRWEPVDEAVAAHGVDESRPLEFHSPYGCSKGAADQYVLDFARTFGVPAAVFRLSCIYGPHQFGTEDQGWVAHFLIRALRRQPITLFGDGKQVRDILFVSDLLDALLTGMDRIERIRAQAFNLGGGPARAISLLELLDQFESLSVSRPPLRFAEGRPGDQRYYVSDSRKAGRALDWSPKVSVHDGVARLHEWLAQGAGARIDGAAAGTAAAQGRAAGASAR